MNDFQILPSGAELRYTFDFAGDVPADATVQSIGFAVVPIGGLTLAGQSDDLSSARSSIEVSGSAHGMRYLIKATATLDNGEKLTKVISLLGYAG